MLESVEQFTLKQLSLPAKLVVTLFLLSVGLGYLSAMVQLHFKDASKGNPMPTASDVVARYAGEIWPPVSEAENSEKGGTEMGNNTTNNTTHKATDQANPQKIALKVGEVVKVKTIFTARCLLCHQENSETAQDPFMDKWDKLAQQLEPKAETSKIHRLIIADEKVAFGKDSMVAAFTKKSIVDDMKWKEQLKKNPEALLIAEREKERLGLVAWLEAGAPKEAYDQDRFVVPEPKKDQIIAPKGPRKPNAKNRQISVESLTQSTHAHLLSFSMLYSLTGIIFAFSSFPSKIRIIFAPWVLFFQIADISCWWLARLEGIGPYFAIAILGTGGLVGLGLMLQIIGSIFSMYNKKGKTVLVGLFLLAIAAGGITYIKVVAPQLAEEKAEK